MKVQGNKNCCCEKMKRITDLLEKIEKTTLIKVIREALTSLIPVVLIGAFALVIKTLPIDAYQKFITGFASGFFYDLADIIFMATFGMLSLYMIFFVSRCYMRRRVDTESVYSGAVIASMVSFFILAGINLKDFSTDCTSAKSIVLAEFVENKEQRDELHRLGCDIYQGYLYSPAVLL